MQIPLDYYRILGLPMQATAEQLEQAHRDRTLQLPRREYSEYAIKSRKQLVDAAHVALKDSGTRQAYDAQLLAAGTEPVSIEIYEEMANLNRIIDFMLSYAGSNIDMEDFNVRDLLIDLFERAYRPEFEAENIQIQVEI